MPFRFLCPACKVSIKARDDQGGRRVKCPGCNAAIEVPIPKGEIIAAPPPPLPPPPPPPAPIRQADPFDFNADESSSSDWGQPTGPVQTVRIEQVPGFRCPYCSSGRIPKVKKKVSSTGWVVFWVLLLLLCLPLCWIGLLMKDEYRECVACGMKLGG